MGEEVCMRLTACEACLEMTLDDDMFRNGDETIGRQYKIPGDSIESKSAGFSRRDCTYQPVHVTRTGSSRQHLVHFSPTAFGPPRDLTDQSSVPKSISHGSCKRIKVHILTPLALHH